MIRQVMKQKRVRPNRASIHQVQLASGEKGIVEFTGWASNLSPATGRHDTTMRSRVVVHTGNPSALPSHIGHQKAPVSRSYMVNPATKKLTYTGHTSIRHSNNGTTEYRRGNDGKSHIVERVFRAVDQHGQPIVVRGVQKRNAKGHFGKMQIAEYWRVSDINGFGIYSLDYKAKGKLRVINVN
jgi:hypothetical protein